MPGNNDLLVDEYVSPNDCQLTYVLDTIDTRENTNNPNNTTNNRFTDGQMNAVIFWIEEHPEFIQEYMDPVVEYIPAIEYIPAVEFDVDSSDDSSSDEDDSSSDEDDIEIIDDEDDDDDHDGSEN